MNPNSLSLQIIIFNDQRTTMQTATKKVINGWAMYDWANSAYNLVITSTIFPAYYVSITAAAHARRKVLCLFFWKKVHQYCVAGLCIGGCVCPGRYFFTDPKFYCRL